MTTSRANRHGPLASLHIRIANGRLAGFSISRCRAWPDSLQFLTFLCCLSGGSHILWTRHLKGKETLFLASLATNSRVAQIE